ncbi:MAG: T9SS type A sorting domain-containing protein [Saprospiraceae bacterium]|nr:T9SS type A sorting domain-containing protein [Saprospiraceae bacterium]
MKNRLLYTAFGLLLSFCLFQSSSSGRATAAGSGNTGAPGDSNSTCISCHGNNADIQVDLNIEATNADGLAVTQYEPETTYTLKVSLDPQMGSPAAYGFQMLSLNAPLDMNGDAINSWVNASSNANIVELSNRTYVEHTSPSSSNEFTVDWVAPSAGAGVVTFYACGNGVNLNGSTSGDNADCATFVFEEAVVSSTQELANTFDLSVAPNPARDFIQLSSNMPSTNNYQMEIYSLSGQLLRRQSREFVAGEQTTRLPIENLIGGIYIIRISSGQKSANLKFVKL